jgi:predicted nucleic acid-binding protein
MASLKSLSEKQEELEALASNGTLDELMEELQSPNSVNYFVDYHSNVDEIRKIVNPFILGTIILINHGPESFKKVMDLVDSLILKHKKPP